MDRIEEGMRIQFPNSWDETPGPTLVIVRVEEEHVFTRSEVTGAIVVRPRGTVLLYGKEVR